MVLRRLFGGGPSEPDPKTDDPLAPRPPSADMNETATVKRIVGQLEALPIEQRRFVAGFAYVLGRAANADLVFEEAEVTAIEQMVVEVGGLTEAQSVLVVEIARNQAELYLCHGGLPGHPGVRPHGQPGGSREAAALRVPHRRRGPVDHVGRERGAQRDRQGAGLPAGGDRRHPHGVRGPAVGRPGDAPGARGGYARLLTSGAIMGGHGESTNGRQHTAPSPACGPALDPRPPGGPGDTVGPEPHRDPPRWPPAGVR